MELNRLSKLLPLLPLILILGCQSTVRQTTHDTAQQPTEYGVNRAKAEKGDAEAQYYIGKVNCDGEFRKDYAQAIKWLTLSADQGYEKAKILLSEIQDIAAKQEAFFQEMKTRAQNADAIAQYNLGTCYYSGQGTAQDLVEAVKWFHKAADQGVPLAQFNLGYCYYFGIGVTKDPVEAARWFREAAERDNANAQLNFALCLAKGDGVAKDYAEAYKWANLASAHGDEAAKETLRELEIRLTAAQVAEGQRLSREFKPRAGLPTTSVHTAEDLRSTGTGFFITDDGYLISNNHVVRGATRVRVLTSTGLIPAKLIQVDAANDLALLKAEGQFAGLPIVPSRTAQLGSTVATVGFPNIGLQGFAPKLAKGEIASLSGAADDARYFQISVPLQPGNSGGALVNEYGSVVGVVSAKLDASAALATSGSLPENVNYAIKSSFLLGFLESVPELSAKLKDPITADRKFEDVVKSAEAAALLVVVY